MSDHTAFLIRNADLLNEEGELTRNQDLIIAEGRIASITPAGSVDIGSGVDLEVIDGSRYLLSPGLINTHTHSPMNIFRGISEDVDADTWFNRDIWPFESLMKSDDVRAGTRLAILEMIDCGVTAFCDHYFGAGVICEEANRFGLRLNMAPTLFGMAGEFERQLAETEELFARWRDRSELISFSIGPHSPYTCSPEELKKSSAAAQRHGIGMHLHLSETAAQVAESLKQHGKTPFGVAYEAGVMNRPLIIGHGIYLTRDDRKLLGEHTVMSLSPKTYLKMGMGLGNIFDDHEELPLAIGTDGAASSNSLNPIEQARILALLGKDRSGTGAAWNSREIWKLLMAGHALIPSGGGRLAVGAPADIVLWDLHGIRTSPLYNPLSALIYSSSPAEVRYVWTAGRLQKADGMLLFDEQSIIEEAEQRVKLLLKRGRGETKLLF